MTLTFCMSLCISLDVWHIFVRVLYQYVRDIQACNEWNSVAVACNTTRRRLFWFVLIKISCLTTTFRKYILSTDVTLLLHVGCGS